MSKVAFRSRQLDFHKPVPIYWTDELAELSDPSVVTRAIPYIPSGMEKEEETEQHLQWALSSQEKLGTTADCVIPIPDVQELTKDEYEEFYRRDFKLSKHLIRIQTFGCESEFPDYDLDVEDEKWLAENGTSFNLSPLLFESMIDRLEKGCGQQVLQLAEAKALLKEDDDLTTLVYNYWLAKRQKLHHPLILHVKTDKRDVLSQHDPYVAFRRRAEKMQTRKNRKSDEISYERMCKLKRDCGRLVSLLELIRRREKSKKELIQLAREVFGKRYEMQDFDGRATMEAEVERLKDRRPAFMPQNQQIKMKEMASSSGHKDFRAQKRPLEQQKAGGQQENRHQQKQDSKRRRAEMAAAARAAEGHNGFVTGGSGVGSAIPDDVALSHLKMISKAEQQNQVSEPPIEPLIPIIPRQLLPPMPEGRYAFKRMAGAVYLAPHPLRARLEPPIGLPNDSTVRERLHASHHEQQLPDNLSANPLRFDEEKEQQSSSSCMLGYARLRRGRGARFVIDRAPVNRFMNALTRINNDWSSVDERSASGAGRLARLYRDYVAEKQIPLFNQRRPPPQQQQQTKTSAPIFPSPMIGVGEKLQQQSQDVLPPGRTDLTGPLASLLAVSNGPSSNGSASHSPAATLRPNTPHHPVLAAPVGPPAATLVQQLTILTANQKLSQQPPVAENHVCSNGALTPKSNNISLVFPTPMVTLLPPHSNHHHHHHPQQQQQQQLAQQVASQQQTAVTPQLTTTTTPVEEKPAAALSLVVHSPPSQPAAAAAVVTQSPASTILAQQQQKFFSIATAAHQSSASLVTTNGTTSPTATTPNQQQQQQQQVKMMVMMDAS